MDNKPLVSIVTPMYNAEKYIKETIESVKAQTYSNWEMIIVDNCSTDSSKEIVKNCSLQDHRIKLIELDVNSGGPARPRNVGIQKAEGKYIAFLDADDIWHPQKVEKQLGFMQKENLEFSSTNMEKFYANGHTGNGRLYTLKLKLLKKRTTLQSTILFNIIFTSSVMIRNDGEPILFSEDKELIAVEDLYLWLKLLDKKNYGFLDEKLLKYRIVESSASNHTDKTVVKMRHNYAVSKYILSEKRFDLVPYYYIRVVLRMFL